MFDWLVEGSLTVYVLLGVAAVFLGTTAVLTRKRGVFVAAIIAGVLLLLYFAADLLVETETERVERILKEDQKQLTTNTEAIADGMKAQDLDKVFQHVSESFRYGGLDKKGMRRAGESALKQYQIRDTKIWDIEIVEVNRLRRLAKVHFSVKAQTNVTKGEYLLCKSEWVLDPDEQWRMKTFQLFNPVGEQPLDVPLR